MRILVADDDHDAVSMLEALLYDEGHQVQGVHKGIGVLSAMRTFDPDAVVVDIKMPGMNGYDVARTICSRYGEARPMLIAVSGHFKRSPDQMLAQIAGFDHFFPKPCDPNALLDLLRS
jgi:DNA-binding response OmpR family regulator